MEIAFQFNEELLTLLIQNPDLVKMFALPFTRELTAHGKSFYASDDTDMAVSIKRNTNRLKQKVATKAQRAKVVPQFRLICDPDHKMCFDARQSKILVIGPKHKGSLMATNITANARDRRNGCLLFESTPGSKNAFILATKKAKKLKQKLNIIAQQSYVSELQELLAVDPIDHTLIIIKNDMSVMELVDLLKQLKTDIFYCSTSSCFLENDDSFDLFLQKMTPSLVLTS
ncbi:MAG: hypothetical protein KUG82_09800 [Pseudomonadales bacterium]|nr:hypothetical protein [Pseudomonadales bacterium]